MADHFAPPSRKVTCQKCKKEIDLDNDEYEVIKRNEKGLFHARLPKRNFDMIIIKCPFCGAQVKYVDPGQLPILSADDQKENE